MKKSNSFDEITNIINKENKLNYTHKKIYLQKID